jgi:xanthine dehydrogenase accessory factor
MDTKGGMICGGYVEVLVAFIDGHDPAAPGLCQKILSAYEKGESAWLIHSIAPEDSDGKYVRTGMGVAVGHETDAGSLELSGRKIADLQLKLRPDEVTVIADGRIRYLIQPVVTRGRVIIAGAGHVGHELAGMCAIVGLETIIIDDRPEYANRKRFPEAGRIMIPPASYEKCLHNLSVNQDDGIIIVTRGHEHDRAVLLQALQSRAGYIGMIGSRRKRDTIYERLITEGVSKQELSCVHCPIGIDIGAETPAEIAVSIVAELIAWRHRQL